MQRKRLNKACETTLTTLAQASTIIDHNPKALHIINFPEVYIFPSRCACMENRENDSIRECIFLLSPALGAVIVNKKLRSVRIKGIKRRRQNLIHGYNKTVLPGTRTTACHLLNKMCSYINA